MAKLKNVPENLKDVLQDFGRQFLGKDATLDEFEEIEAGVSYNYKVKFGDQSYILKVDNPNVGMRSALSQVNPDSRSNEERFNQIAHFIDRKISQGMKAAGSLPVPEKDGKFCVVAGAEIPEFSGNVVSMQRFLEIEKPKSDQLSEAEISSLANNIGILHRPTKSAENFPTPNESAFGKVTKDLRDDFRALLKDKTFEEVAQQVQKISDDLGSNLISRLFPEGKCTAAQIKRISEVLENFQTEDVTNSQISHNDLHGGNMLRDGTNITLIDFDELGKSGVKTDLFFQFEPVLNIFDREKSGGKDATIKQAEAKNFITNYLAHNPYLSREELMEMVDFSNAMIAGMSAGSIIAITQFGTAEKSEEAIKSLGGTLKGREWMMSSLMNPEQDAIRKEALGIAYDEVFSEITKGGLVDALTDSKTSPKTKDPLEYLDLATAPKATQSWVEKVSATRASQTTKDR